MKNFSYIVIQKNIYLFLLAHIVLTIFPQESLIEQIKVENRTIYIKPNKAFKSKYLTQDFFIEYDSQVDINHLDYSIQIMPFLMNVLSIVWISGKTYYIDEMDEDLFHSLKKIKIIFRRMYPKTTWDGEVIPKKLVKHHIPQQSGCHKNRIALTFSLGLDSTFSSLYHKNKKQLLITAWGHFDTPLNNRNTWLNITEKIELFAKKHDHIVTYIKSNFHDIFNLTNLLSISSEIQHWRICTVEGLGWVGMAAPIIFSLGYKDLFFAASYSWDLPIPVASNPLLDENVKFSNAKIHHDGYDFGRVDKCQYLTKYSQDQHEIVSVRVCQRGSYKNCSSCAKCLITILGFLVAGADPKQFGFFDIPQNLKEVVKNMLNKDLPATSIFFLQQIADKIKLKIENKEDVSEFLHWFYYFFESLDLVNKKMPYAWGYRNKKLLDWKSYIDVYSYIPDRLLK